MSNIKEDIIQQRMQQVSNFAQQNTEQNKRNYKPEKSVVAFDDKGLRKILNKLEYIDGLLTKFQRNEDSEIEGIWFESTLEKWRNLFDDKKLLHSSLVNGAIEVSKKRDIQQFIILLQHYKLLDENIFARLERQQIFYYTDKNTGEKVYITKFEKGIKTLKERQKDIKTIGFPCVASSARVINTKICEIFKDQILSLNK